MNEPSNSKKDRVITLLISFNRLTSKVLRLEIKDKQALGLLAEALQINKQILSLAKDNKISLEFVRQTFSLISIFVKEVVSKWLRYNLTPLLAMKYIIKRYAYNWTIDQVWPNQSQDESGLFGQEA